MNMMHEQMKRRWGVLRRAVSNEIIDFISGYDPAFERALGVLPRPGTKAALRDPAQKRQLWLELWCHIADMIAAHEAGYVRAFPERAEWAAKASALLRTGVFDFQRQLSVEQSDMPRIDAVLLDPATGRHYAVVSAVVPQPVGAPS